MSPRVKLTRHGAGEYSATVGACEYTIIHSGPSCWAFWPSRLSEARAMDAADACDTLREVKQKLASLPLCNPPKYPMHGTYGTPM